MNPVDAKICKADEQRELQVVVEGERSVRRHIVEFCVPTDLGKETRSGEDGHQWHRDHGLADLEFDLVLEVLGMGEGSVVENENIGEGGADEVKEYTKDPKAKY